MSRPTGTKRECASGRLSELEVWPIRSLEERLRCVEEFCLDQLVLPVAPEAREMLTGLLASSTWPRMLEVLTGGCS